MSSSTLEECNPAAHYNAILLVSQNKFLHRVLATDIWELCPLYQLGLWYKEAALAEDMTITKRCYDDKQFSTAQSRLQLSLAAVCSIFCSKILYRSKALSHLADNSSYYSGIHSFCSDNRFRMGDNRLRAVHESCLSLVRPTSIACEEWHLQARSQSQSVVKCPWSGQERLMVISMFCTELQL